MTIFQIFSFPYIYTFLRLDILVSKIYYIFQKKMKSKFFWKMILTSLIWILIDIFIIISY